MSPDPPPGPPPVVVRLQSLFGRLLAIRREERNLDQSMMAKQLGMSAANLSRIECGLANLTVEQLFLACQLLDQRPSDVVFMVEEVWRSMEKNYGVRVEFTKTKQESTGRGVLEVAAQGIREGFQPFLGRRYRSKASWWTSRPPAPEPNS